MDLRLSDKHLVWSLASVFEMISSLAFNVSMFILWSLIVAVPFFVSRSAASTSHDVFCGTYFGSVWIMVLRSLSNSSVYNSSVRSMIYLDHEFLYPACLAVLA